MFCVLCKWTQKHLFIIPPPISHPFSSPCPLRGSIENNSLNCINIIQFLITWWAEETSEHYNGFRYLYCIFLWTWNWWILTSNIYGFTATKIITGLLVLDWTEYQYQWIHNYSFDRLAPHCAVQDWVKWEFHKRCNDLTLGLHNLVPVRTSQAWNRASGSICLY